MGFLEKLERKFGRYAIRNLMMYLTVLYSIGFAISLINIEIYYNYLSLDIPKILSRLPSKYYESSDVLNFKWTI